LSPHPDHKGRFWPNPLVDDNNSGTNGHISTFSSRQLTNCDFSVECDSSIPHPFLWNLRQQLTRIYLIVTLPSPARSGDPGGLETYERFDVNLWRNQKWCGNRLGTIVIKLHEPVDHDSSGKDTYSREWWCQQHEAWRLTLRPAVNQVEQLKCRQLLNEGSKISLLHDIINTRFTAVVLHSVALLFCATSPNRYYHTVGTTGRHSTWLYFYVPDQSV